MSSSSLCQVYISNMLFIWSCPLQLFDIPKDEVKVKGGYFNITQKIQVETKEILNTFTTEMYEIKADMQELCTDVQVGYFKDTVETTSCGKQLLLFIYYIQWQ